MPPCPDILSGCILQIQDGKVKTFLIIPKGKQPE
jgi:hypothetical protein